VSTPHANSLRHKGEAHSAEEASIRSLFAAGREARAIAQGAACIGVARLEPHA
jgi:hypothetical protein